LKYGFRSLQVASGRVVENTRFLFQFHLLINFDSYRQIECPWRL